LAGGYNSNIFKLAERVASENSIFLPIGRRAVEYYKRRDRMIFDSVPLVSDMGVGDAVRLGERVARAFAEGSFSGVSLVYTEFLSMLSCQPKEEKILPMEKRENASYSDPIYEGDMVEMLDKILPTYVGGMLNAAVLESSASEQSSRRNAMSSANKNAKEIIDTLSISYNRARQAAITQEITEIVSGAEAL
jgi:F-type H+-transporting ATPase subunit gamma